MKKLHVIFISALIAIACDTKPSVNEAEWLIGTWQNQTSRGNIYETWSKKSDRELVAKSYLLEGRDTVILETIQILQEEQQLFYIPTVATQNDGKPVRFTMKKIENNSMIFENSDHDFPQVITYTKIGNDSLIAFISGVQSGQETSRSFKMKRIK